MSLCDDRMLRAASRWGLSARTVRHDLPICGSPERCVTRAVIEAADGGLYVMEEIGPRDIPRKTRIHANLDFLARKGLESVNPYLRSNTGDFFETMEGRFWQVSRFIPGIDLKRPDYVLEKWRGPHLSEFLINLKAKSEGMPEMEDSPPFSIMAFIRDLAGRIARRKPALRKQIDPAIDHLETDFAAIHDRLPAAFCHGDFHALNIIWSESGIHAVIDWEFSGIKPAPYDAAMMIGCLGSENPDSLAGPLVKEFIDRLKAGGLLAGDGLSYLAEFVLALRFAWLSEWLRHDDRDMIALEITYMDLLCRHAEDLRRIWEMQPETVK